MYYTHVLKRSKLKSSTSEMVNVDTDYLRFIVAERKVDLPQLSEEMGYCREYLGNCIGIGRINKNHLAMLSYLLDFPYKRAVIDKKDKWYIP